MTCLRQIRLTCKVDLRGPQGPVAVTWPRDSMSYRWCLERGRECPPIAAAGLRQARSGRVRNRSPTPLFFLTLRSHKPTRCQGSLELLGGSLSRGVGVRRLSNELQISLWRFQNFQEECAHVLFVQVNINMKTGRCSHLTRFCTIEIPLALRKLKLCCSGPGVS